MNVFGLGELENYTFGCDENGKAKLDERKLRRALEQNQKLGRRNKDIFLEGEKKATTCPRYNPCPICDKCLNKASHLYVACQTCQIPICAHTYQNREQMIKRKNFVQYVSKNVMESIKALEQKIMG